MACNAINSWTFAGLVGAFLDLSIAYLLLCASALAYLYSKILGLFGLSLPCPCDGLFGYIENKSCLQSMLVNDPSLKISAVQSSVKKRVPFDSIWNNSDDGGDEDEGDRDGRSNLDKWRNGGVEMEGEASSSSWNERKKKKFVGLKSGSSSVSIPKWKGFGSQRARVMGLKRRKRADASCCHRGKLSSSWYDQTAAPTGLNPSASVGRFGSDINEESATTVNSEDGRESSKEIGLTEQDFHGFRKDDDSFRKNKSIDKELDQDLDGSDKYAIRILEQALEEEHAACTALYHELEKERTAAATAADEALAMILRLQEEKATIEMEARQYQRMIEEKSAYDAEEMNILKEILLRREKEKLFLEKEVEAYKQMLTENEQLDADMYDIAATQEQMPSNEEPLLMLQQTSKSVGDTKFNSDFSEYELTPMKSPNQTLAFGKELPIPKLNEDAGSLNSSIENSCALLSRRDDGINHEFQEKGMASDNKNLNHQERYMQDNQSTSPQGSDLHKKAFDLVVEEEEKCREPSSHESMMPKTTKACDETKLIFPYNNENMGKQGEDLHGSDSGIDYRVHDIHVIYDEAKTNNEESGNKSGKKASGFLSNLPRTCNSPIIGGSEIEPKRKSNSSDRSGRLPPIGPSRGKTLPPISRRNSMSAFDYERSKIDSEVGWLRERLKMVQQGREKLSLPAGPREREQVQLQMLENIACQLREIRQLTEPGKALRRASLPPPSSKVMPKRRHSLGASFGLLRNI